jgi:hypothetical protein
MIFGAINNGDFSMPKGLSSRFESVVDLLRN